jgi:hypothetical protein
MSEEKGQNSVKGKKKRMMTHKIQKLGKPRSSWISPYYSDSDPWLLTVGNAERKHFILLSKKVFVLILSWLEPFSK